MKTSCTIELPELEKVVEELMPSVHECVEQNATRAVLIARQLAPKKSGDLRRGIVAPDWEENSKLPNKVGREVFFDYRMNDTFVKISKSGERYYYPASQEYGFRIAGRSPNSTYSGPFSGEIPLRDKVPGIHFMKNSRDLVSDTFRKDMENVVKRVVGE